MKSIIEKENNTSQNAIPRGEIFKSVDHVKYEGQVRSGQVSTFVFVEFLVKLMSCRVTYENYYKSLAFKNLV